MRLSSELSVNLSHLAYNFEKVNAKAAGAETIFMVKADAYGHGIAQISDFSFNELKIKRFGCASIGEAIFIRETNPQLLCELWVFSDLALELEVGREAYLELGIIPVIHSMSDLKLFLKNTEFRKTPLVLKFDTGMHRLGISHSDVDEVLLLLKAAGRSEIEHVMTHFSCSYLAMKKGNKTERQLNLFEKILDSLRVEGISINETSCANSGAIEQGVGLNHSHIRPGLMMYGGESYQWCGKSVSSLKTKVLKTYTVKKGMPVGYGGHVCGKDGYIALLAIGYGDGFLASFSGKKFEFYGKQAQVLGRVNMDLTSIFFEELPVEVKTGSEFIVWGEGVHDINLLAAQLKTIPYQLFTAISTRVPRRYLI